MRRIVVISFPDVFLDELLFSAKGANIKYKKCVINFCFIHKRIRAGTGGEVTGGLQFPESGKSFFRTIAKFVV